MQKKWQDRHFRGTKEGAPEGARAMVGEPPSARANVCLHCFISGHVQGVFFRRETRNKALEFQLTGWVRNLPDGRVEAVICGYEEAVALMKNWLWEGPPAANVTHVEVQEIPWQECNYFEVR